MSFSAASVFSIQKFPVEAARANQPAVVEYILKKVEQGYRDIVVGAPTGSGKSLIGLAAAFHLKDIIPVAAPPPGEKPDEVYGAYYIVTQKLLQDQITDDVPHFKPACSNVHSLKSSTEYECRDHGTCDVGGIAKAGGDPPRSRCSERMNGQCTYQRAKLKFCTADIALTNYSFFFAAVAYADFIPTRQVAVFDECHGLEDQIIKFVDAGVSVEDLEKWLQSSILPRAQTAGEYADWLSTAYLPRLAEIHEHLVSLNELSDEQGKEAVILDKYICKLNRAVSGIASNPDNWVYWKEKDKQGRYSGVVARPIYGSQFAGDFTRTKAKVRIYMSAYPGAKDAFCKGLGLAPDKVAWGNIGSEFPVERRKVLFTPVGSMGTASKDVTTPLLLARVVAIATKRQERGLIHCVSYDLGTKIYDALCDAGFGGRVSFPKTADDRIAAFERHRQTAGSILISPSMTEGFDFANDAARWQIIAKMAYPYLGDPQICARKEQDPEWYMLKTFMAMLQACGRVCRSQQDWGTTYVLDADFKRFMTQYAYFMPKWFKDAIITS